MSALDDMPAAPAGDTLEQEPTVDSAAFLDTIAGPGNLDPGASRRATQPSSDAGRPWNSAVRRGEADRLLGSVAASWHHTATPATVTAAGTALHDAARALQVAEDHVLHGVDAEQYAEGVALERAVVEAVRSGKTPQPPASRDWDHERRVALAVHAEALRTTQTVARGYTAAVEAALPTWWADLLEQAQDDRAAAAEALAAVLPLVEKAHASVAAVHAIAAARDASATADAGRMTREAHDLQKAGRDGAAATLALLRSNHVVHTGKAFGPAALRGEVTPPLHVREAMWDRDSNAIQVLGPIEAAEGWKVTKYTWDWRHTFLDAARAAGHGSIFGVTD